MWNVKKSADCAKEMRVYCVVDLNSNELQIRAFFGCFLFSPSQIASIGFFIVQFAPYGNMVLKNLHTHTHKIGKT